MTDLKDKTVKQLRRMSPGYDALLHDCVTGEAADELARRLKEAQQKTSLGTSTDYASAYQKEKVRADGLRKMLDEQIQHTANAIREAEEAQQRSEAKDKELDEIKAILNEWEEAVNAAKAGRKE